MSELANEDLPASAALAAAQPQDAAGAEVAPCNTTSNKCISIEEPRSKGFLPLWQGIDTLVVSYKGDLREVIEKRLARLKELAQSKLSEEQASAQYVMGDEIFSVGDKGNGRYSYVLNNPRYYVRLSRYKSNSFPFASVQIQSAHLVAVGVEKAVSDLRTMLAEIADVQEDEIISRFDLTLDFVTGENLKAFTEEWWVTTAESKLPYYEGDGRFTGWTFGRGADESGRLYDKKYLIEKIDRGSHFHELWLQTGWFPPDDVWRMEFQIRRPILKVFKISTVRQLLEVRQAFWDSLTTSFVRLTIPNHSDQTRSRWLVHPLWDDISNIRWTGPQEPLTRTNRATGAPSDEWLARHAVSLVTSMMAREGLTEPKLALALLEKLMYSYLCCDGPNSVAEDALVGKARVKARKYGSALNPESKAVAAKFIDQEAAEYRSRSDRG